MHSSWSGDAAGDSVAGDLDAFGFEGPALTGDIRCSERAVAVHDAPPRQTVTELGEESADRASAPRRAGAARHFAVRHDLALLQFEHRRANGALQIGQG